MATLRTIVFIVILGLLLISGVGITSFLFISETNNPPGGDVLQPAETSTNPSTISPTGSLFMIGHWANTPTASTTALIERYQVAGVIIMSTPEDTTEIVEWITEWNNVSEKPLLISIDQEGGPVTRLKGADFIQTGQKDILTADRAYQVGLTRGRELAALGINMNFAPVLDIAVNPDSFMFERVFPAGTDSAVLGNAMRQGMEDAGVQAVAKHFPGHDDTSDDSHFTLPVVTTKVTELPIFTRTFANYISLSDPKAIMTAHVLFPEIDDLPATLSSYFLTDYLREELGFRGVVITDDMSMDAIDAERTVGRASTLSLQAGADLILIAAEPFLLPEAVMDVREAIELGDIKEEEVAEKIQRIDLLR